MEIDAWFSPRIIIEETVAQFAIMSFCRMEGCKAEVTKRVYRKLGRAVTPRDAEERHRDAAVDGEAFLEHLATAHPAQWGPKKGQAA